MKKTTTVSDDIVLVYCNPSTIPVFSIHANFDISLEEHKLVAFDEYNEILCYGNDSYHYSIDQFNKISSYIRFEEMTYREYLRKHQEYLAKLYPDAPIIAQIDESSPRGNPILQNLSNLGINVKICR